jgi:hypothetical protein
LAVAFDRRGPSHILHVRPREGRIGDRSDAIALPAKRRPSIVGRRIYEREEGEQAKHLISHLIDNLYQISIRIITIRKVMSNPKAKSADKSGFFSKYGRRKLARGKA